jgi:hypothetical protein
MMQFCKIRICSEFLLSDEKSTSSLQAEEGSAKDLVLISPQEVRNMTKDIRRLCPGSLPALPFRQAGVRLDNFSSLSFLKLLSPKRSLGFARDQFD